MAISAFVSPSIAQFHFRFCQFSLSQQLPLLAGMSTGDYGMNVQHSSEHIITVHVVAFMVPREIGVDQRLHCHCCHGSS